MTSRLEQQANRALLIALTVFVGALFFNINTGNKTMGLEPVDGSPSTIPQPIINGLQQQGGLYLAPASNDAPLNYNLDPGPTQQELAQQALTTAARNNFNTGKTTLFDSVNRQGDNKATEYRGSINDWLYQDKSSQDAINAKGVNAEMARNQGVQGIRSMVGNGIKSAGVMLANKNAGSSSATGALANAYGQLGQRQMQQVGNQYGLAQNQIGLEQQNLEGARNLQKGKFNDYKTQTVNAIVDDAQRQMAALNADAANASLPDQIAIQQEVERIRGEAMGKLQQFDSLLATQSQATTRDQRMSEATRLSQEGMAGDNPFQFTTEAPGSQFQYQAPAGGGLPIYTYNNKNKYQA